MKNSVKKEVEEIVEYYNLKCSTIKEFRNCIKRGRISSTRNLSLEFIREFKNEVSWKYISRDLKLSEDFIKEFKDYINLDNLLYNELITEEIKNKIRNGTIFPKIVILYPENNFSLIDVE